MAGRSCLQDRQIAGAFGAKLEIITNQNVARTQLAGEDVVDKMLGAERGKAAIEVADVNLIHAVRRKQFQLLAQAGESRRCCIRAKQLARMRLERHHRRRQIQGPRLGHQLLQHGLMPAMHTVEVADGHGAAGQIRAKGSAKNQHGHGGLNDQRR